MFTYESLEDYISFFSDEDICFYEFKNGHVSYHERVNSFISDFYNSGIARKDYNYALESYLKKRIPLSQVVKDAPIDIVRAVLTYYIRMDRFCEGTIAKGIKDNTIRDCLIELIKYYK